MFEDCECAPHAGLVVPAGLDDGFLAKGEICRGYCIGILIILRVRVGGFSTTHGNLDMKGTHN